MSDDASIYRFDGPARSRVRLSDAVLGHLTQLVLDRALRPGDALPSEAELARSFEVSKPVVREALRQLAAMGVVEIRQGRPSCISGLTSKPLELYLRLAVRSMPEGLREALELRRALEAQTVSLAATRRDEKHLERLSGLLAIMAEHRQGDDAWASADVAFHHTIAEASGNMLMTLLMQALTGIMEDTIRALQSQRDLRDADATFARHVAIVRAIEARDVGAAGAAMAAHFAATAPVALRILEEKHRQVWR